MIHEEIDQILEQAFKNVMRKSKFFQANRKILRKFLDAIKQEIENFACHEESEEGCGAGHGGADSGLGTRSL